MSDPWLVLQVQNAELQFSNREELDAYMSAYSERYKNIQAANEATRWRSSPPESNFYTALTDASSASKWLNRHHPPEAAQNTFKDRLLQFFNRLPPHTSDAGIFIAQILDKYGVVAASGAAAAYNGEGLADAVSKPLTLKGVVSFQLLANGLDTTAPEASRLALEKLREQHLAELSSAREQFQLLRDLLKDTFKESQTQKDNLVYWWEQKAVELSDNSKKSLAKAIQSFQTTEETYKERMKLDRPRQYWAAKAQGHEDEAKVKERIALAWLILSGICSVGGIWLLFQEALRLSQESTLPATAIATLGAMGIAGTTVAFWIARLLVRLWLSQIHLGMDARERVTMIESYLALTAEGAVDEKQREIVLSALFRPTQDGIVKDDASADPTIAGLISKLANR